MYSEAANRSSKYDVLIIGGGVIGLSIARQLHKNGVRRIAIVDRKKIGTEASFAAAGMLLPHVETDTSDAFYRFCVQSFGLFDDFGAELYEETGVDIELNREGTLYLAFDDNAAEEIGRRFDWQTQAGIGVEKITAREILSLETHISPEVKEGLFFPNDWHVENRKLLLALRKYSDLNGISIYENYDVSGLSVDGNTVTGAVADGMQLRAEKTVLATGAWTSFINIGSKAFPIAVKPLKGQMICFRGEPQMLRKIVFGPSGYLVPRADGRILAGATVEDVGFNKEVTAEGVESLRLAALEMAPAIGNLEIVDKWAGLRPVVKDKLPVLGGIDGYSNLYVATAHFRNGILLAPLTAQVIAQAVCGKTESDFLETFGTRRFAVSVGVGSVS